MLKSQLLAVPILFVCFVLGLNKTSAQNWEWVKMGMYSTSSGGGIQQNDGTMSCMAIDGLGNCYLFGFFGPDSIAFDSKILKTRKDSSNPNPYDVTRYNATSGDAQLDLFLVKYNAKGEMLWTKSMGGTDADLPGGICLDKAGNVWISGYFSSAIISLDSKSLRNNTDETSLFWAKYDTNGNLLQAKSTGSVSGINSAGGEGKLTVTGMCADGLGNVYMAGNYRSDNIKFDTISLAGNGSRFADIFIVKCDLNAQVQWARRAGGDENDKVSGICADKSGNVYVTGVSYSGSMSFGGTTIDNSYNGEIYLAKYSSKGQVVWVRHAGSDGIDGGGSLCCDKEGNIYVSGYYNSDTLTFKPFKLLHANKGSDMDGFLVKYSGAGNILWARNYSSDGIAFVTGMNTDASGAVYLIGNFSSPSLKIGSTVLTAEKDGGIFISKYDAAHKAIWAKGIGGTVGDNGSAICPDGSGTIYVCGYIGKSKAIFDNISIVSEGNSPFVAKLSDIRKGSK